MAMKPNTGSHYTECWKTDHKVLYTACNHMSKTGLKKYVSLFIGVNTTKKKKQKSKHDLKFYALCENSH